MMFRNVLVKMVFALTLVMCPVVSQADQLSDEELLRRGIEAFDAADIMGALPYLTQAANKGHARAQTLLGYIMARGEENEAAQRWYLRAAEQGDAEAQLALAELAIERKKGADISFSEGIEWLNKSVEQSFPEATAYLARALEDGSLGMDEDLAAALLLYQQAAEAGHSNSMLRLISAYQEGQLGLSVDAMQAERWHQRLELYRQNSDKQL